MKISRIPIDGIVLGPGQKVDEDYARTLAASYDDSGPSLPPVVRISPARGLYVIVSGEQRWMAAKIKGLKYMECIVETDINDAAARKKHSFEDFLNNRLNVVDQGEAFLDFRKEFGLTRERLAKELDIEPATVSLYESLVTKLAPCVIFALRKHQMGPEVAFELAKIDDKARQHEVFEAISHLGIEDAGTAAKIATAVNFAPFGTDINKLALELSQPARTVIVKKKNRLTKATRAKRTDKTPEVSVDKLMDIAPGARSDEFIDNIVDFYDVLESIDVQQLASRRDRIAVELGQVAFSIDRILNVLHMPAQRGIHSCEHCNKETERESGLDEGWSTVFSLRKGKQLNYWFCCYDHLSEWLKKQPDKVDLVAPILTKKPRRRRHTRRV